MRRRSVLAAFALAGLWPALAGGAPRGGFDRGLLWQVRRPGTAPSWLFGTLHRPDRRLLPLPPPVEQAFQACRRFALELLPDEAGADRFSEGAEAEPGGGIAALLPGPAFARLAAHLEDQGMASERIGRLKPWAALLLLTSLPPGPDATNSIDSELWVRARLARMSIDALDSVEEQIATFDAIPSDSQLALLHAALDFHELLPAIAEAGTIAYLARDLRRLQKAGRELEALRPELAKHQRALERAVLFDRSVVMAYRLQPFLRRGASFVAIGASHLYGRHGVPALLQGEYGWTLRRVW